NLFFVLGSGADAELVTPELTGTLLPGITRDSLITLARDMGREVVEEPISRDQLYIADEVFVCGTAAECVAVGEIDYRTVGSGKMGPVTRDLQRAFFQTVRGQGQRSAEWLDYVPLGEPVTGGSPARRP
ncbi:MAG: aminotransferase class IV, partial [Anaerolineales bacterium]